jgi:DNA polymerase
MHTVVLDSETDEAGWRTATRALVLAGVPPQDVLWTVRGAADLFAEQAPLPRAEGSFSVSRALVELAGTVIQARDPQRFALLYSLVWRAHRGEQRLAEKIADPEVSAARALAQSVRRDTHKMRAFLRFREVEDGAVTRHVAWFEPAHYIVEANAPFFVRRFAAMTWSILTPDCSAHWDGAELTIGPGAARSDLPADDAMEPFWAAYFAAIFNPARLKVGAMTSEMPKKYWRNLPEAAAIPDLIRGAGARTRAMVEEPRFSEPRAARAAPEDLAMDETELQAAKREAMECRLCPLWAAATQTVFGEGPEGARMMLIGEQPGDQEDLQGRPFVGPAGQVLDRALAEAGIDRSEVYVTNSVKHFKFEPRGKRRIHMKPEAPEIEACRFWLDIERARVRPRLLVLLGATAARSVMGRVVTIGRERGRPIQVGGEQAFVTVHPSYLLRLPDEVTKKREYAAFVADLREAALIAGRD